MFCVPQGHLSPPYLLAESLTLDICFSQLAWVIAVNTAIQQSLLI